jgi:DNA-binding MarR family transcriptional regulator
MRRAERRTRSGEAATELILMIFRTNGLLLADGDVVARSEGLTAARWQVLGAIVLAERPLTVPQIARRMGLTRQSVHATVGRLVEAGLVEQLPNADHQRSQLLGLTERGRAKYAALDRRQAAWVNRISRGLEPSDLRAAAWLVGELAGRLERGRREGLPRMAGSGARRRRGGRR